MPTKKPATNTRAAKVQPRRPVERVPEDDRKH
jgi:hypothetical protein